MISLLEPEIISVPGNGSGSSSEKISSFRKVKPSGRSFFVQPWFHMIKNNLNKL